MATTGQFEIAFFLQIQTLVIFFQYQQKNLFNKIYLNKLNKLVFIIVKLIKKLIIIINKLCLIIINLFTKIAIFVLLQ